MTGERLVLNHQPVLAVCDHQSREVLVDSHICDAMLAEVLGDALTRICRYHALSKADFAPLREAVILRAGDLLLEPE
jgi:hypothetical protein